MLEKWPCSSTALTQCNSILFLANLLRQPDEWTFPEPWSPSQAKRRHGGGPAPSQGSRKARETTGWGQLSCCQRNEGPMGRKGCESSRFHILRGWVVERMSEQAAIPSNRKRAPFLIMILWLIWRAWAVYNGGREVSLLLETSENPRWDRRDSQGVFSWHATGLGSYLSLEAF